jgi:hypothetical protein
MSENFAKTKEKPEPHGPANEKISYYFIKSLIFLGFFSIIHFIYELAPSVLTLFFGAADESVFGHTKMAFYAWFFSCLVEFALHARRSIIENKRSFFLSRIFATTLLPWFEMLVWYVVPGIVKVELPLYLELPWSFAVVYMIGILAGSIERAIQNVKFDTYTMVVIFVLFGLSVFFFTVFTLEKPWIDYFYLP